MHSELIAIRGGGDLATGVAQAFWRAGFRVLVLEAPRPTAIRRSVALCEAVYDGQAVVEDLHCRRVDTLEQAAACHAEHAVPLLVDPAGESLAAAAPAAVVDAILAKRNLGTHMGMAPVTIGLGPGFAAGQDVRAVIETMRGHDLGRMILEGSALPNTGVPGEVGGRAALRVLHAPAAGRVVPVYHIGSVVQEGEPICYVGDVPVPAPFTGLLRGLIRGGLDVPKGMKIADIDPRRDVDWNTISDKARALGGAALVAYLYLRGAPRA